MPRSLAGMARSSAIASPLSNGSAASAGVASRAERKRDTYRMVGLQHGWVGLILRPESDWTETNRERSRDRPGWILNADHVKPWVKEHRSSEIRHELFQSLGTAHRQDHGHDCRRQLSVFMDVIRRSALRPSSQLEQGTD